MNRLTQFVILWSLAISIGTAQETATIPDSAESAIPDAEQQDTSSIGIKVTQLRADYEAANKQIHDLAESLRQTPDAAKKAELRTAVQRTFTLRQSLLRAELQEMQARLEKTQQSLEMRDRMTDQIVDRRVEDLLNPQLEWDGSPSSAPAERANNAASDSSSPPAPIGRGLPEEIDAGAWGEPENGLRLAIVVQSENSPWNEAQEIQYIVENVSKEKIALRGQRNDQLATLCEVRQTSQAQVQTMPRVNSGVSGFSETGNNVELMPGERVVIARVWMGVVEKEMDAIPGGDPQLLVIDPDAWKFQNKIYLLRGCLQPDPNQPTIAIRSGQVGIAFHKLANSSVGSHSSSPSEVKAGTKVSDDTQLDQTQTALAKLQGYWDFQELSVENPEPRSFPNGLQMIYEIRGNRMASLPNEPYMPTWHLQFGEPGIPQSIDLNTSPDHPESPCFLGIIEITEDVVRICSNNSGGANAKRPTEFAVTKDTDILELRRRPAPVTELEGDWHVVAYYDHEGKPQETLPSNRSFRGDQSSFVRPGYRHDCRIKVDPIKKTLWSYSKEEDGSFGQNYYELKGNQLILRNEPDAVGYQAFERGLVRIPSVVPPATSEQKLLWRSAIVEMTLYPSIVSPRSEDELVIGRGIVISSNGMILSQFPVSEDGDFSQTNIKAKFDDGSMIPLKLIEEAGQGWAVLQPEQPIDVNHFFEVSTTEAQLQDEVRVWAPDHSQAGSESLAPFANTVSALDRKYPALGIAVWQLRIGHRLVPGTPILDADGDLLGMTITGARDLLLAIPVAELKAMFPNSFGQQIGNGPPSFKKLPDWLNDLQGTWTVTNSPIKVDENSGGQMKEIRIDRDQWSIVWTAKPGEPDRVETLRVTQPDEKNLLAIDLIDPSTGKVVYPSLYELNQAGLTFCYGHLGTRPREIGNTVTIQLTREKQ